MSPRRSFPLGVTAPLARACGIGTAGPEIQEESPLAPADTALVAGGDTRIVSVFGHRHAWTTRFSAQIIRANGDTEELYDSFNWAEMPTFQLDSLTTNPPPRIAEQIDGAKSGLTILHKGDKVQFACHVDTTAVQAQKLGVPVPTANLQFANEAIGAEMCVLYLETTGSGLGSLPH